MPPVADMGCRAGDGVTIAQRRRKHRGAKGDEGVGWGPPSQLESGLGRGLCPSPENFWTSEWKMVLFRAFWELFLQTNFLQIPLNL